MTLQTHDQLPSANNPQGAYWYFHPRLVDPEASKEVFGPQKPITSRTHR